MIEVRVPDIGDFKDVPVVEIPVKPGDTVAPDDTLVVLESDKATLDVPAPQGGRVCDLKVAPGDRVSKGSLVLLLEAEATKQTGPETQTGRQVQAGPPPQVARPAAVAPASQADRTGDAAAPADRHITEPDDAVSSVDAAAGGQSGPVAGPAAGRVAAPVYASPSIRRYARTLGADVSQIAGSGPKGRLTREDIEAYVKSQLTAPQKSQCTEDTPPAKPSLLAGLPDWPTVDHARFGPVERQPLSRIARISGPALARNAMAIPHVTNFDKADVTDIEAFRRDLNAAARTDDAKLTMLAFAVKAVVATLKAFPKFNASLDGDDLVLKRYWNIGVAADTPGGLVVPVIKEADRKGLREIATEMARLAGEARDGRIKASDMQGATFTISSLGGVGGTNFTPIINAPEVAILGMVRAETQPVWDGAAFQPRLILPLSLSWDHRVVDGVAAARFLGHLVHTLSDFRRVIM